MSFDKVVVMDQGVVVEVGAPAALMAAGGLFYDLVTSQRRQQQQQHRKRPSESLQGVQGGAEL
jgi:ABC-type transport system involved in cytochrome bd biosynthesis fused ATPase/permease subunit